MSVYDLAMISLVADDDQAVISGGGFERRAIKLSTDPEDLFSDELDLKIIETSNAPGGIAGQDEFPVRTLTLPFNLRDTGAGIENAISRFRKLWRSNRTLRWEVTTQQSGLRWLMLRRSHGIKFSPARDWNQDGYARAVVTAVAVNPFYESPPLQVKATTTTSGTSTYWFPTTNPTDQKGWLEWSFKPNGSTKFTFPDFSFGNEQQVAFEWTPGQFANRAITTVPITVPWSVMSHPLMDTYVAADLSNASAQMGANEPLFWIPPYTTSEVLLPVTVNGPAGAEVKMILRRFWSAESGLE